MGQTSAGPLLAENGARFFYDVRYEYLFYLRGHFARGNRRAMIVLMPRTAHSLSVCLDVMVENGGFSG